MDFKRLRTFRSAATTLNFSETAVQLNYVQSAVTAHIRGIEDELGVRLFDRSGRKVQLTTAGIQLLHYADELFALKNQAEQAIKQNQKVSGQLTIAGYETVITYRLPKLFRQYANHYPDVELGIRSLNVQQLSSMVANHQVDVAYILGDEALPSGLEQQSLGNEEVVIIASPDHPLAKAKKVVASDLANETILFTEQDCNYRKLFQRVLRDAGVFPHCRLEFISIEAIKSCVKLGMGIAAISRVSAARELENGELVALNWQDQTLEVRVNLIWHGKRWLSPAVTSFLEMNHQSGLYSENSVNKDSNAGANSGK